MTTTAITASVNEGRTYYTATRNGTEYTLAPAFGGKWFVYSRRLALGRFNTGGGKHYDTLAAVSAGCKALAGIDQLVTVQ